MTKLAIGEALAGKLFAAEAAIDMALAETAGLVAMFPSARADAYLSAVAGQRAFEGGAAAVSALAEARGQLVATHNSLAALARKMGMETLAVGPLDKPPERASDDQDEFAQLAYQVNKVLPAAAEPC